ncbi:hypothetical protein JCM19239_3177 [Vibrio variabilis]|uniref:Uncharacterized protein n=1 Tax=Vibrio variabilis TaxID=990271 RepID=A0ABQ0JPX8_9VIBR|nr:hypothetical protein JCM19239_3177 [Vibrio variabilis]
MHLLPNQITHQANGSSARPTNIKYLLTAPIAINPTNEVKALAIKKTMAVA